MGITTFFFGAILLLAQSALPLGAQEFRLGTGKMWTDHQLLADPYGFGGHVGFRVGPQASVRLGYEHYRSGFLSRGSLCVGLIPPDAHCRQEPLRDRGRVQSVGLAVPFVALSYRGLDLGLVPGLRVAHLNSERRSTESSETLSAGQMTWGADLGLEAGLQLPMLPLRLHVATGTGLLFPLLPERVMDGYTPFQDGMAWKRAEVGFSYTYGSFAVRSAYRSIRYSTVGSLLPRGT